MIALYNYLRTCHHHLSYRFTVPLCLTLEPIGSLTPAPLPQSASGERCFGSSEGFSFLFSLLYFTELFPRLENKT